MNQKTNIHASSNYHLPRLRYHLDIAGREHKEETLTQAEEKLYKILSKVRPNTVVGKAIAIGLSSGVGTFRKLIGELKDQQRDSPALLEKIIGSEAMEIIKRSFL
jgi:hypothetical protein